MFNIDNAIASQSSVVARLEGNKIHDVKFVGVEAKTVGNTEKFDVVSLKFEGVNGSKGIFEDTIFAPKLPQGAKRQPNNFGGENPSQAEELQGKIRHYIAGLNPDLDAAIEAGTKKINAPDWDTFRKVIVKALEKSVGKETQIKLLKDSKGNAIVPNFIVGLSKEGKPYLKTNFIGEGLTFTDRENKRIAASETATPTNVNDILSNTVSGGSEDAGNGKDKEIDFDLENL